MTDMTRSGPIVRTEDTDGTEEDVLAHIEAKDTVEETHTVDLGRRNAMSVTDQAVGQPSTPSKNDRKPPVLHNCMVSGPLRGLNPEPGYLLRDHHLPQIKCPAPMQFS